MSARKGMGTIQRLQGSLSDEEYELVIWAARHGVLRAAEPVTCSTCGSRVAVGEPHPAHKEGTR